MLFRSYDGIRKNGACSPRFPVRCTETPSVATASAPTCATRTGIFATLFRDQRLCLQHSTCAGRQRRQRSHPSALVAGTGPRVGNSLIVISAVFCPVLH